jgi:high-affinity iron transporter
MLPAFLITFREVIEATLIVATILGILLKLNQKKEIKTVWLATGAATAVIFVLLLLGSLFGVQLQHIYTGKVEATIEGSLMIISAMFITWAVFFLHKYFSNYKVKLLQKLRPTIEKQEQRGLFILVFTAVFREGFEIVLFLTTIYFSSNPQEILSGFGLGVVVALIVSFTLFTATVRMPIYYAFRVTSILLILFAAGLLAKGIHEFAEVGVIPEVLEVTFPFLPASATLGGDIVKAVFGISKEMDLLQIIPYTLYTLCMVWWVFLKNKVKINFSRYNSH